MMKILVVITLGTTLTIGAIALAEKGNWTVPQFNVEKTQVIFKGSVFKYDKTGKPIDADKDGDKETYMIRYRNDKGQKILVLQAGDKQYGWLIQLNPKDKNDTISNYVLLDMDGNGSFESKYPSKDKRIVPDYI